MSSSSLNMVSFYLPLSLLAQNSVHMSLPWSLIPWGIYFASSLNALSSHFRFLGYQGIGNLVIRRKLTTLISYWSCRVPLLYFSYEVLCQYVRRILRDYTSVQVHLIPIPFWSPTKFIGKIPCLLCYVSNYSCFMIADTPSTSCSLNLTYQLKKFCGH